MYLMSVIGLTFGPNVLVVFRLGEFNRVRCGFLGNTTPPQVQRITEFVGRMIDQKSCLNRRQSGSRLGSSLRVYQC